MKYIAGVDIGNSTTEVCIGTIDEHGQLKFLSSACGKTTGTKGTLANIDGIKTTLAESMNKINIDISQLDCIRINEATPVIGDTAMETIRSTIITESAMIGHNPDTPAGVGCVVGKIKNILWLQTQDGLKSSGQYILVVPKEVAYEEAAQVINQYEGKAEIVGLILQSNEANLVENRLNKKIPIIDEVANIAKVPEDVLAAIEVSLPGETIKVLSNPYGVASVFGLTADETKKITLIAKSLTGNRSAVVIKTPFGEVTKNPVAAGVVFFNGEQVTSCDVDLGAAKIMAERKEAGVLSNVTGLPNTNIGNMLIKIKTDMSRLTGEKFGNIRITDFLAVDTFAPVQISGAIASESCLEKAVGVAAMVKTDKLPMKKIADALSKELKVFTKAAGVEAVMAALGAMTTPGTELPLAILDLGGGSSDAALIDKNGAVRFTHLAGAGELVTLLIATELAIDKTLAEQIKKYPLAKVESFFHIRHETGNVIFYNEPLKPIFFGNNVLIVDGNLINTGIKQPMEKIASVRKNAKQKVFVENAIRALKEIAPDNEIRNIPNVVLLGGSSLDFEIPEMIAEALAEVKIVCGRGNVRNSEGPRNAVATGLLLSYLT